MSGLFSRRRGSPHHILLSMLLAAQSTAFAACPEPEPAEESSSGLAAPLGLSAYEPIYFIAGGDGGLNAKFQVSFKYQIFSERGWFSRCLRVPSHIYLAYSQTSLWDLDEKSSPFKDTSYRPRLFYLKENEREPNSIWKFDFEAGIAHESNGKAKPESRSVNTAYARPTLSFYLGESNRVYIAPMLVSYLSASENSDIEQYRGNVDLLLGYGSGNNGDRDWNAWTVLRKGTRGNRGSIEANLAIPFAFLTSDRLNGWFLLQYFSGQGESLLDYDKKLDSQVRGGFAILVQ